jgi:hypothetical protein
MLFIYVLVFVGLLMTANFVALSPILFQQFGFFFVFNGNSLFEILISRVCLYTFTGETIALSVRPTVRTQRTPIVGLYKSPGLCFVDGWTMGTNNCVVNKSS